MTLSRPQPFILTLKLDAITFSVVDDLRRRYFPAARNFIPAHVTLFHALPAAESDNLQKSLHGVCRQTPVLELSFAALRFLGRGVAIDVLCPALVDLRQRLVAEWGQWLKAQDKERFRPHVTIQNKVSASAARRLYETLGQGWRPFVGRATGLLLWHYRGGPWELAREFLFAGGAAENGK